MKRVVKLTEQDLYRIVKRVIKEQAATTGQAAAPASTGQAAGGQQTKQAATGQPQLGGGFRNGAAYRFSQTVSKSDSLEYKGQVYQLNKNLSDVVTTMSRIPQGQDIWKTSEVKPASFCETLLMKDRGIYIKDSQGKPTNYAFKCSEGGKGNDFLMTVFYKDPAKTYSSQG